ncbi:hypothetical protein ACFFMN_33795 [Planobispora siamensis]|uniref:Uncharacterized protein n=1 Tax=Planobispora siamensis TaxID=936338 RepID=A0A8J3SGC6_9ACTN|nr:hypothetical protein [Planobispora siamensis]GIH91975.1 hypothetical protein Psi01_26050 [Planobispora siamensis]
MDISKTLRALQDDVDRLADELAAARRTLNSAARAYDDRRRYAPSGTETTRAHTAWALALTEWAHTLIAHAAARDRLASERRNVDQAAADHFMTPTRRAR